MAKPESELVEKEALNSRQDEAEKARRNAISDEELWNKEEEVRKKSSPLKDLVHLPKASPKFIWVLIHPVPIAWQTSLGSSWRGGAEDISGAVCCASML